MTPLHLLDFQKEQTILSHFDDFFGVFMGQEQFSKAFFTNLIPLSPNENGELTFFQQSHECHESRITNTEYRITNTEYQIPNNVYRIPNSFKTSCIIPPPCYDD
jgi:hypothetical protein